MNRPHGFILNFRINNYIDYKYPIEIRIRQKGKILYIYQKMGKRRLEKIEMIQNNNHRKVTYCKRKKGLLKKSIELSLLCDVSVFVLIYDKKQKRCVHYASDSRQNILNMFNDRCNREFYSNKDYVLVGGRPEDVSTPGDADGSFEGHSQAAWQDFPVSELDN